MALTDEGFRIVAMGWSGSRDIVDVEGAHQRGFNYVYILGIIINGCMYMDVCMEDDMEIKNYKVYYWGLFLFYFIGERMNWLCEFH